MSSNGNERRVQNLSQKPKPMKNTLNRKTNHYQENKPTEQLKGNFTKNAPKLSYESSEDESDIELEVLQSVIKNCDATTSQQSLETLVNAFQFGAVCLICISKVKRNEKIYSCTSCFTFFHLSCIQRWANDSLQQKKLAQDNEEGYYNRLGDYIPKQIKALTWNCPKCRESYHPDEIPRHYTCFCKKQYDPVPHDWLLPHSCGELCLKPLSGCSHTCLLLCHPGACPPCPKMLVISCDCEKSPPKAIRCNERQWNCKKKCNKKLECGHACEAICCKPGTCPPCLKKSGQACRCGSKIQERNCFERTFTCNKICGKQFPCKVHKCEKICCDDCKECTYGLLKSCPCGKQLSSGLCTELITSCGDTCNKNLPCGLHTCLQRCHIGECSECLILIEKSCRCGLFTKEVPCSKEFTCETKCKKLRSCKKHPCSRKCCPPDAEETLCEKLCGKTLHCGKHKCQSLCHSDNFCYPCNQQSEVKCKCGVTTKNVPCGSEKRTKPPKCRQICNAKSKCHHSVKHSCHFGACPPCQETCGEQLPCDHSCAAKCHDYVKIKIKDKNFKPTVPGEYAEEKIDYQKLDHPQCEYKVPVTCLGRHETALWPCWNSKPNSCGRMCGQPLDCTNHKCELECHVVTDSSVEFQYRACIQCKKGCELPRPTGCAHVCNKPCHPSPCNPCLIPIKVPCFCGLIQVQFRCSDYYKIEDPKKLAEERAKLLCCGNRCSKNYPCGHRCMAICHPNDCPNPESCKKKQKVYCKCQNRKIEITCDKIRGGFVLSCDTSCKTKQQSIEEAKKERERLAKELEEQKNRQEIEKYEQKFAKRVYKERRKNFVEEQNGRDWKKILIPAIAILILITAMLIYYVQH